jgi:CrcB protein
MTTLLWIGIGGSLGSIARALCASLFPAPVPGSLPLATLFVNILGSFIIGFVYGRTTQSVLPATTVAFLTTGFCGGFTTFSAFSIETVTLLRDGHTSVAVMYIGLSVVLGLTATLLGMWAARQWS